MKKQERKNNAQSRVSKSTHRKDNLINTGSDVEEQNQGACPIGDVIEEVEFVIKKECSKKLFNRIITHPIDELHRFVDPGSVDVIITEPPCKEEDIDLFDELGDFARHALKDGGVCITICENRHLIDFMEMLRAHLDYVWLVSLDTDAVKYEAPNGYINKLWKPVLVFSKGNPQMKTFSDVKNDVENIVQSFSDRGDIICDPFCNEGEIAKICVENSRSLVASDMDVAKTDTLKDVFL